MDLAYPTELSPFLLWCFFVAELGAIAIGYASGFRIALFPKLFCQQRFFFLVSDSTHNPSTAGVGRNQNTRSGKLQCDQILGT